MCGGDTGDREPVEAVVHNVGHSQVPFGNKDIFGCQTRERPFGG